MKDVGVVKKCTDAAGEFLPDQIVDVLAGVEMTEILKKGCESRLVG